MTLSSKLSKLLTHKKKHEPVGRDPKDVNGTEFSCDAVSSRMFEITCFFFCCGWAFNLLDRSYSALTHQDRVIGEGKKPQPGIDHLDSLFINSSLEKQTEYEQFIKRYYQDYNVWTTRGEEQGKMLDQLLNQLYKDTVARRYRKDQGSNIISWTATLLGASVAIIEFARNIVVDDHNSKAVLTKVGYVEGALGLLALIVTQMTNKQVQMHAKASSNLDELRTWTVSHVKDLKQKQHREEHDREEHVSRSSIFRPKFAPPNLNTTLIKCELVKMKYQVLNESHNNLCGSISVLRKRLGFHETYQDVQSALMQCRSARVKSHENPTEGSYSFAAVEESSWDSLIDIEDLARRYDCPIIVISEHPLVKESCYQIINETVVPKEDEKEADDPETYQAKRESQCMILYSAALNRFQPVIPPISITFSITKQNLIRLSSMLPAPTCSVAGTLESAGYF